MYNDVEWVGREMRNFRAQKYKRTVSSVFCSKYTCIGTTNLYLIFLFGLTRL